jgi:hypothetical protein
MTLDEFGHEFFIGCAVEVGTRPKYQHRALGLVVLAQHDDGPFGEAVREAITRPAPPERPLAPRRRP